MNYIVGIFGSAFDEGEKVAGIARKLAVALSKYPVTVFTGGCSGVPYIVAKEASRLGLPVWGISPEINKVAHEKEYTHDDIRVYQKLVYVPRNYRSFLELDPVRFRKSERMARKKLRNITSTANCDAGIIISGRWGTMNEFTNLYDMGKIIGILTGTGGIADEIPKLLKVISKKTGAKVIMSDMPKVLVEKVVKAVAQRSHI